jgi:1-deoxy-D-xylulose-5-phosphate synthase
LKIIYSKIKEEKLAITINMMKLSYDMAYNLLKKQNHFNLSLHKSKLNEAYHKKTITPMLIEPGDLLKQINSPADLRKFDASDLYAISTELRQYIIDMVSVYGGHFGASLGVVELSVALHYVFNTPDDQLVWDVGHQAYGHKILTGRRDIFHTNRIYKGISGFPKRKESPYDAFGVGHSSTSISAALGMALASKEKGEKRQHIAVIGDGSMTAGMAFEAMNHAGAGDTDLLIILNDNCMSIDPNVGALKDYLTDITTSSLYNKFRDEVWRILGKFNRFGLRFQKVASIIENAVKGTVLKQSNLFEALGLRYFGPVDGHDINHLVSVLKDLKNIPGPKLLHCVTVKGKGYELAEKDQTKWHAPGTFDKITGEIHKKVYDKPQPAKYQDIFGYTILDLAKENPKIMGVTPAMPSGSSLNIMMKEMPKRAIDVGIAEQHAVTVSAGMATQGMTVFCNIYSSFMQRAYDQVVHDVCIQELPVIFCLDRAGFAGADGPTHHGNYDIAYMRCVPNMMIFSPMNEVELRNMMYTVSLDEFKNYKSAISIRYPRGEGVIPDWRKPFEKMEIGKGRKIHAGEEVAILTLGHIGNYAVEACKALEKKGLKPAHYDMRFVKPLDSEMLHEICQKFDKVITIEDGCLQGGFGSAVLEWIADNDYSTRVKRLGIPDRVVEHGTQLELHRECGFAPEQIAQEVEKMWVGKAVVV